MQSKVKFKNFLQLSSYSIGEQDLIKKWYAAGYVDYYKCNKCIACLHIKKRDWFKRCLNESTNWKNCYFITLTFDNQHYQLHNKKRLLSYWIRDHIKKYFGSGNYKYFAVSEYGSITNRFHFHLLLFTNYFFSDLDAMHYSKKHNLQYCSEWLNNNWRYGFHTIDLVHSLAAFKYCVKYTTKSQQLKVYCSRGFGNYIKDFDAVNYEDLPRSILTNAYARLWNANRRYKRHEITREQLDYVFRSNEPYNALKLRYKEYWRLHAVNKYTTTKQLATAYATKYLHTINTKMQL